ncbi:MAG TPA: DUF481 domain-containing protein [Nannocystis exedens]|nr:DUF481 domain-containing protein [Nannocystis exedens]
MTKSYALPIAAFVLLLSGNARAEDPAVPAGTTGVQAPASSGSTEIDGQGTFATAEEIPEGEEEESTDATELSLSAGGLLSTGNARAVAGTGAINFRLRRDRHQFSTVFAGNYGAAAQGPDDSLEKNVANLQGKIRYDVFFAKRWSAFLMLTGRNDYFQGLDIRINIDPGVAFHILTKKTHRLWVEAGYDFQYAIRNRDAIAEAEAMGGTLEKTNIVHAARLFVGYSNHLSEKVSFDTGLEYLQSVTDGKTFRFNWDNALTAQLVKNLAISGTFTLRYENNPVVPKKLDTITAVNLVYRFF